MSRSILIKVLCIGLTLGTCGGLILGAIATKSYVQQVALYQ